MNEDLALFFDSATRSFPYPEVIYLACPYSANDTAVMRERMELVTAVCAKLLERGDFVISPLNLSHPIAPLGRPKHGWYRYCVHLVGLCDTVWVIQADGWQESEGVKLEIAAAIAAGKLVRYLDKAYVESLLSDNVEEDIPF